MELVALMTIIFAFVASPQIGATCTKQYGKISNNIEMDSCPNDYYGNMPISNNFQINLEMDSYEMSKRFQIAQYQLESFIPYKNFQFLSGAYALQPDQDSFCNEEPIYIYVPIEKASIKNAIDWNEDLKVPEKSNIDDDDQCFASHPEPQSTTQIAEESSLVDSDLLTLPEETTTEPSTTEETTTEEKTTEETTTVSTPTETEDLSLCGEDSGENKNVLDNLGETDSDENDEVRPNQSRQESEENIDNDKKTTPDSISDKNYDILTESSVTSTISDEDIVKAKKVPFYEDTSGHLFVIVTVTEVISWETTTIRKCKIDKNGNLADILTNNKIKLRFQDDNNAANPKRKNSYLRDENESIINIEPDGNLDNITLNLADNDNVRSKKVYKVDKRNNLVDVQNLQDFVHYFNIDSHEIVTQRPPSKFYTDIYGNRVELLQTDILFLPDYSWSSEDVVTDKSKRKYKLDKNGNLVDVITGEDAGINWEFIDEKKLKPILDKRGNVIIVVLNSESYEKKDFVISKYRRVCRLDINYILIGYSSSEKPPKKTKKKPTKKPTIKPPSYASDEYSMSVESPQSKEKKVTEETHPDMFKDTDCSNDSNLKSKEYGESEYSIESDELSLKKVKSKIPSEMFVDTNCSD